MISITSRTNDPDGVIVFEERPESDLKSVQARLSMYPLLNGGTLMENQGAHHGDRELRIIAELTEAQRDTLWDMIFNHTEFRISLPEGVFYGGIQRVSLSTVPSEFYFFIEEKGA